MMGNPPYFSQAYPVSTSQDVAENQVGIYVAATGNVTVTQLSGASVTLTNVQAGTFVWMRVQRITAAPAASLVLYA